MKANVQELLTPADVGRILGLTPASVRDLARRAVLPIAVLTERGNRLFRREDVEKLARTREIDCHTLETRLQQTACRTRIPVDVKSRSLPASNLAASPPNPTGRGPPAPPPGS